MSVNWQARLYAVPEALLSREEKARANVLLLRLPAEDRELAVPNLPDQSEVALAVRALLANAGVVGQGPSSQAATVAAAAPATTRGGGPASLAGSYPKVVDMSPLLQLPDEVLAIRFSVFYKHRARSTLQQYLLQHGLRGEVRRLSPSEVKCLAVTLPGNIANFAEFITGIGFYAPRVGRREDIKADVPASVWDDPEFPLEQVVSKSKLALEAYSKGIQVFKLSQDVKRNYEDTSCVSDDPDDAVTSVCSLARSDRLAIGQ